MHIGFNNDYGGCCLQSTEDGWTEERWGCPDQRTTTGVAGRLAPDELVGGDYITSLAVAVNAQSPPDWTG